MKILIIEDSVHLRRSLETGLKHFGCAVDASADGVDGLWRARNGAYDVVVLDILLPGMDGWSVLRSMREAHIQTPVIVLTARDTVADRVAGLDGGADDYLVKPFAFEELLARIRSLYRRSFGVARSELQIGTLHIDLRGRRVRVGAERVELTRREYSLLEYLALHSGQLVTRSDIEDHLYDDRREPMSNVVDAAVARLRRKLEAHPGAPSIKTQRGMGYLLDEHAQ